jgi:hypothetical protein
MIRLVLLTIVLFASSASADLRVFFAPTLPAGEAWLDVQVGDGRMALEAYAGDRHREIGQAFTASSDQELQALTMTVGGGRVLFEGVARLSDEMLDGSIVGFVFDESVRLERGGRYAIRLKFLESAPGRAVSFRVGSPRGRVPASFILSTDEEPWRVAVGRSVEMRLYAELDEAALTFVPRRVEDVEPKPASNDLVADLPTASLAQRQYRPDVYNVHGIWHTGGGEQRMAQTFTWPGGDRPDTILLRLRDFSVPYHGNAAGAPLQVAVVETTGDTPLGEPLGVWQATLPDRLRHSTYLRIGVGELPLEPGRTYAFHLILPESAPRRHLGGTCRCRPASATRSQGVACSGARTADRSSPSPTPILPSPLHVPNSEAHEAVARPHLRAVVRLRRRPGAGARRLLVAAGRRGVGRPVDDDLRRRPTRPPAAARRAGSHPERRAPADRQRPPTLPLPLRPGDVARLAVAANLPRR